MDRGEAGPEDVGSLTWRTADHVGIAVVAPRGQSLGLRSLARTAPIETLELRPGPGLSAQKGWCKCPQRCLPSRPAQASASLTRSVRLTRSVICTPSKPKMALCITS